MAAIPVILNGVFTSDAGTTTGVFQGTLAYSDRGVGGGPIVPPSDAHPEHPIVYPPGSVPHPEHPIVIPEPPGGGAPPPDVAPGADKKPPPGGGWGYVATWDDGSAGGWGLFGPGGGDKPNPPSQPPG